MSDRSGVRRSSRKSDGLSGRLATSATAPVRSSSRRCPPGRNVLPSGDQGDNTSVELLLRQRASIRNRLNSFCPPLPTSNRSKLDGVVDLTLQDDDEDLIVVLSAPDDDDSADLFDDDDDGDSSDDLFSLRCARPSRRPPLSRR